MLGVPRASFDFSGPAKQSRTTGGSGKQAVRNFCQECGSLLFGTPESDPELVTLYAGSLDDSSIFSPREALFTTHRPSWAKLAVQLVEHATLPGPS